MALAAETHMAGLAFRTAGIIHEESGQSWYGGFILSLIFAPICRFALTNRCCWQLCDKNRRLTPAPNHGAKASGLMQLVPDTAAYIAGDRRYRDTKRHDLLIPEVNIRLGEDYILYLLKGQIVGSDLIRLLAAYNAGPGNLRKWSKDIDHGGDMLILLESLRARETRFMSKML